MHVRTLITLLLTLLLSPLTRADDWPHWFGPQSDGVYREPISLSSIPKDGLPILWRTPIAAGFSGPAVAAGRVYLMDRTLKPATTRPKNPFQRIAQPGNERVLCLDESTGKILWTHAYDCDYTVSYSSGPRTTPAVDGDRVYTLGAEGDLLCLDAATGTLRWSKHLSGESAPTPIWGFAGHPLVDGDRLICLTSGKDPGGNNGGNNGTGLGIVTAFNKLTGDVIWTALADKEPGYAPPTLIRAAGRPQLVVWHPAAIDALDPATGKPLWSVPFGPARNGLTVMTPRFAHDEKLGDVLLLTTQYEGATLLKLDDQHPAATVLWRRAGKSDRKTDALHSLVSAPVIRDGHVYGVDIYGELRCLDLATGDRLWSSTDPTTYDAGPQKWASAFLIPLGDAGSRYLIPNEHGDLILADLTPAGYHELGRTHLLDPTNTDPQRPVVWSFPALADHSLFWRNDKELLRVSLDPK